MSTKKCCPCTVNIACHVKQSIIGCRSSRKGEQVSKTNIESVGRWKSSVRTVPTATTRILRSRFPGTCETVGQVFKFVWRLRWKVNVVCMSLSPFFSFQSRIVTHLLAFTRTTNKRRSNTLPLSTRAKIMHENWSINFVTYLLGLYPLSQHELHTTFWKILISSSLCGFVCSDNERILINIMDKTHVKPLP